MKNEEIPKVVEMLKGDDPELRKLGATMLLNGATKEQILCHIYETLLNEPRSWVGDFSFWRSSNPSKDHIIFRKGDWGIVYFRNHWAYGPMYKINRLHDFYNIELVEV